MTQTLEAVAAGDAIQLRGKDVIEADANAPMVTIYNLKVDQELVCDDAQAASIFAFANEQCRTVTPSGLFWIPPRGFMASPAPCKLKGPAVAIVIQKYRTLFHIGGPIESHGRLRYIDGCTDTLLVAPLRRGDPCLNHLHFPKNIRQTMHTHPSLRCGIVANGSGRAVMPGNIELPLTAGMVWMLRTGGEHCFYTDDEEMDVIAWHPDSDTGPTDDDHPMIRRTIVDGQSAAQCDSIRTSDAALNLALAATQGRSC